MNRNIITILAALAILAAIVAASPVNLVLGQGQGLSARPLTMKQMCISVCVANSEDRNLGNRLGTCTLRCAVLF